MQRLHPIPDMQWLQSVVNRVAADILQEYDTQHRMIAAALAGGHDLVAPHFGLLVEDRERISEAHAVGLEVISWTVNEPDVARVLMEAGIDGLISDDPERMKQEQQ